MKIRFLLILVIFCHIPSMLISQVTSIATTSNLLKYFEETTADEWSALVKEINKMQVQDFIWNGEYHYTADKQELFNQAALYLRENLSCNLTITTLVGNEEFDGTNLNIVSDNNGVIASKLGSNILMFRAGSEIEEEELVKMEQNAEVYIFSGHLGKGYNFYMREKAGRRNFINYGSGENGILLLRVDLTEGKTPVFTTKLYDSWIIEKSRKGSSLVSRTIKSKGFYLGLLLSLVVFVPYKLFRK